MYQANEKRYETMKYHRCGASGLMLPELSLGLWHNFGDTGVYENMPHIFSVNRNMDDRSCTALAVFSNGWWVRRLMPWLEYTSVYPAIPVLTSMGLPVKTSFD